MITIPHTFHYKHTYIYIYTIQWLPYPIPFITNTHIFTFILYNDYHTPYLSLQTHIYLHLYYTMITIPHTFHYKHTYIYIYTIQWLPYLIPFITNTHIFTFILYNDYHTPYLSLQTHIYLHLYYTMLTIPHTFHYKHTYIYIYTIQWLPYPIPFITNTHIFTFILYNDYHTPRGGLQFFVDITGVIWTTLYRYVGI